jgi:hypothetical protein
MIDGQLTRAQNELTQTETALASAQLTPYDKLQVDRLIDDARHNITLIKLGHGVHNVNYSTAALNVAIDSTQKARQLISATPAAPTTQASAVGAKP